METLVYSCRNKNNTQRMRSSSGGVYPLIGQYILSNNGIIFAACYDNNLNVSHQRITDEDGLIKSQGSKYIASKLGETFKQIKEELNEGRTVLFVGTPCQCAGVASFLKASKCNCENMVLVDFVCHGVPGYVPWRAYLKSLAKQGLDVKRVNMRSKVTGWSKNNYSWEIEGFENEVEVIPQKKVPFMKGMIANLYCRPSCYDCKFKGVERITDVTLGDFWGVWKINPEQDDNMGTSLVFLHSEKGKKVFDSIKDEMFVDNADINSAIEANPCIVRSCSINHKRKVFFERINNGEDFEFVVETLTKKSLYKKVSGKAMSAAKSINSKLLRR